MKKATALLLSLLLALTVLLVLPADAADSHKGALNGVEAALQTDKEAYQSEDPIQLSLLLSNTNSFPVEELSVKASFDEGLTLTQGSLDRSGALLEAGQSLEITCTAVPTAAEAPDTIPQEDVTEATTPAASEQENSVPKNTVSEEAGEEDDPSALIIALIIGGAVIVLVAVIVVIRKKTAAKVLCLLLCAALLLPAMPMSASAAQSDTLLLSKTVTVGGEEHTVSVEIAFSVAPETQDAAAPAVVQQVYGVLPNHEDTDGDTLSNFIEIYHTGTDPNLADTDGDGLTDAQEDADGDGIANGEELLRGTNPGKADTDGDGLSDYAELMELGTDPCAPDSDADGLKDADELELGLKPMSSRTDGQTPDAQRTFTQNLKAEQIDERLTNAENAAQPALTLTTTGNINSRVTMSPVDSYQFPDSRALVGEAVAVQGSNLGEGTVTFHLSQAAENSEFDSNLICKFNADGTTEYLDTTYDAEANSVSAPVSEEGTYFVMDVAALFDEMGLEMPTGSGTVSGTVTTQADRKNAAAAAQADIIFIVDSTSSMSDEIQNVKENLSDFVSILKKKGVSAGLALVDYQDFTTDGYSATTVHQTNGSNWYYDLDSYTNALNSLTLGDGGDAPECALDALETARLLDLRSAAGKVFILVTDAPYKTDNRYDIPDLQTQIELLKNDGITCCVISPADLKNTYAPLYLDTNGFWSNIYGDFSTNLSTLADTIGSQIVGDGYWIYLQGPVPVPVRLDEMPTYGSKADTDKDGIPDYIELGGADPTGVIDLDALLTNVSKGVITGTSYGTVMTYEYQSDPTQTDTDFDGIGDLNDPNPIDNHFTGVFHYYNDENKVNVEFNVDYSQMFRDNTVYYKDLSVFAMLCAGNIYADCYTEVKTGTTGGGYDPTVFPALFGMEDVEDIHINAKDYTVDKDDLSEFVVGHKTVKRAGETREIIILTVRGTNATNAEWSSNFDVGADTTEYYNIMGSSHPDWLNKANHKGFDVATNRILTKFYDYIQRHGLEDTPNKTILISGHSRGASISNLLGAHFEDNPDYTSYTYTFATPYCTTDPNAESYKTVFNLVNTDDMIPFLPLPEWGFKKYGTTKSISVNANYEDNNAFGNKEGTFEWLTGVDYNDNGGIANCLSSFSALVKTRKDLYVLDTSTDGIVNIGNKYHTTANGAEKRKAELAAELEGVKLLRYVRLDIRESFGIKRVDVTYCPAYLMQNLANMASSTGPLTGYDVKGKYATAKSNFVTCFISGMTHPHEQVTYYLIARNNFEPLP